MMVIAWRDMEKITTCEEFSPGVSQKLKIFFSLASVGNKVGKRIHQK